ncbi:hypothetical protein N234_18360 [Ralstonia pickettii DTP0602]|nr:hypothetical protein N234_18360 [Ralstonia pickettii DTP0602]
MLAFARHKRNPTCAGRRGDFTTAEAAEYMEVSIATFRRLVRDGKLTARVEVGRRQLFCVADLRAFKRQREAIKG